MKKIFFPLVAALLCPMVLGPAALAEAAIDGPFGISLNLGINPSSISMALDYSIDPRWNLRFGVSPSPQVLELDVSYNLRNQDRWRVYAIGGLAYRFVTSPDAWQRVVGTLGVGIEFPFWLFITTPNPPPILSRVEFGLSSLSDIGGYYPYNAYPGPGIFLRFGTVIRF